MAEDGPTEEVQIEVAMSKSGEMQGEVTVTSPSSLQQQTQHMFRSPPKPPIATTAMSNIQPPEITTAPTMVMSNNNKNSNNKTNSHHPTTNTNTGMGIDKSDSVLMIEQKEEEEKLTSSNYFNESVEMDLSVLRGIQPPPEEEILQDDPNAHPYGSGKGAMVKPTSTGEIQKNGGNSNGNNGGNAGGGGNAAAGGGKERRGVGGKLGGIFHGVGGGSGGKKMKSNGADLEALAELVPGLKTGQVGPDAVVPPTQPTDENITLGGGVGGATPSPDGKGDEVSRILPQIDSMAVDQGETMDSNKKSIGKMDPSNEQGQQADENPDEYSDDEDEDRNDRDNPTTNDLIETYTKTPANKGIGEESESSDDSKSTAAKTHSSGGDKKLYVAEKKNQILSTNNKTYNDNQMAHPYERQNYASPPPRPSDESMYGTTPTQGEHFTHQSSVASISTATQTLQTNDTRTPMLYLPTFRPATGCTNASDFIVRCFVARLRSGITVVKHGRSRWCKSRLRILHVHSDGRSLSWKPAQGEPNSSKRPPKLDLSACLEVRHAWTSDPLNPCFTGTPNLRSKCDASNAFKSFALIFPRRTVDITAVTADQCKVLMEGFSALCYRLQVANMVAKGSRPGNVDGDVTKNGKEPVTTNSTSGSSGRKI